MLEKPPNGGVESVPQAAARFGGLRSIPTCRRHPLEIKRAVSYYGAVLLSQNSDQAGSIAKLVKQLGESVASQHGLSHDACALPANGNSTISSSWRVPFRTFGSHFVQPPNLGLLMVGVSGSMDLEVEVTDQYAAFENLHDGLKTELDGAQVLHWDGQASEEEATAWQPLFLLHPVSKRFALYISSPACMRHLRKTNGAEASGYLEDLYEHSVRDHLHYRMSLPAGSVLVWDNRCTLIQITGTPRVQSDQVHFALLGQDVPLWR